MSTTRGQPETLIAGDGGVGRDVEVMRKSPEPVVQIRLLGECGQLLTGGTPSRANSGFWGGNIPWISAKSLKSFDISDSEDRLTEAGASANTTLVPQGSILFVVRGMSLANEFRVGVASRPVTFNQDLRALIVADDIDARYLARYLQATESIVLGMVDEASHGTKRLTTDRLSALPVPVLPLAEQRRIADVLDRAEALRAKRRDALAQLDALTQAIFLDMFSVPAAEQWPLVTVSEVLQPREGSIRTGPFGSQLLHSEFVDDGIAVLGIDNVVSNEFRWAERRFITEAKYRQLKRYTVSPGDVLITIMGTCGRCAVVPEDIPLAINTKHLCCITLDRSRMLPGFLHATFLRHPVARRYLEQTAKGAIMAGLNMGIIEKMPLPLPPLSLQREFARRAAAVEQLKSSHRKSLAMLDELFASLQHRAFRGEL